MKRWNIIDRWNVHCFSHRNGVISIWSYYFSYFKIGLNVSAVRKAYIFRLNELSVCHTSTMMLLNLTLNLLWNIKIDALNRRDNRSWYRTLDVWHITIFFKCIAFFYLLVHFQRFYRIVVEFKRHLEEMDWKALKVDCLRNIGEPHI